MPIPVISMLVPQNNGTFPTHASNFGLGGYHTAETLVERDAIPVERRQGGMACQVVSEGLLYILGKDLSTWTEIVLTGIEEAPVTGQPFVRNNGVWITLATYLDGGIYA